MPVSPEGQLEEEVAENRARRVDAFALQVRTACWPAWRGRGRDRPGGLTTVRWRRSGRLGDMDLRRGGIRQVRDRVYWVELLRYSGCTGYAHEVATIFGDE